MGQKVNPISLRLGINRAWDSIWFAKKCIVSIYTSRPGFVIVKKVSYV